MFVSKAKMLPKRSTFQKIHYRVGSWTYSQTLDYVGKACQEQTLKLIGPIHKLPERKSDVNMTPGPNPIKLFTAVIYGFP
jgi:hypothetical protein